jgi:adenylosuccinate synthase
LGADPLPLESTIDDFLVEALRLKPFIRDTATMINAAIGEGKSVLVEGAQGTMLDVDHGTYPFVTSSSTVAGNVCSGSGVGPRQIHQVIGISKAYTTRVGSGPFPTELFDRDGETLRREGVEFGATTGRSRRCGWFDAVAVRHAVRINGITGIALTKLDVLTGFEQIPICTAYLFNGNTLTEFPASLKTMQGIKPIYETMAGWQEPLTQVTKFSDLPANAQKYVRRIEEILETEMILISVGPGREQTVVLKNPFEERQ